MTFNYWMDKYFGDTFEVADLLDTGLQWTDEEWACINYMPVSQLDAVDATIFNLTSLTALAIAGGDAYLSSFKDRQKEQLVDVQHLYDQLNTIDDEDTRSICKRKNQHLWACIEPDGNPANKNKWCDASNPAYYKNNDDWRDKSGHLLGPEGVVTDQSGKNVDPDLVVKDKFDRHEGSLGYHYRMNALRKAQTCFLCSIIMVQWADVIICKTRKLSFFQQSNNWVLVWGLFEETLLGLILAYVPFLQAGFFTSNLDAVNFLYPLPFVFIIFIYDEIRKAIIRARPQGYVAAYTYY